MENSEKIYRTLLGLDINSENELIEKSKKLLEEGLEFESFLIAIRGWRLYKNNDFKIIIEKTSGCKINNETLQRFRDSSEENLSVELWNNHQSFLFEYDTMISLYISGDHSGIRFLVFFLSEMKSGEQKTNFIQRILDAHSKSKGWFYTLWQLFHKACTQCKDDSVILFLAEKLIFYNEKNMLLCFYRYYSYIGESGIANIIFTCLAKDLKGINFNLSFFEGLRWPPFPLENLKAKYQKIIAAQNGKGELKDMFDGSSLVSMIPLCIYTKEVGDVETEAFVLWHAIKRSSSMGLLKRMAQITGFQNIDEFIRIPIEHRGRWMTTRLQKCNEAFNSNKHKTEIVDLCKEAFTMKPFAIEVLRGLLRINACNVDADVEKMLKYGIEKIDSHVTLGKLLSYAINTRSEYGLKLVLVKIINLGYYSTILHSLNMVQLFVKKYDSELLELVNETLNFYSEFTPKEYFQDNKFNMIKSKYGGFHKKNSLTENEREIVKEVKRVMNLIRNREQNKMFDLLKEKRALAPYVLEMVLKTAIKSQKTSHIVMAYKMLAKIDGARASFYNFDVEPYFIMSNRGKSEKTMGTNNLVSRIWSMPAVLENPINLQARRVAGFFVKTNR